jgi:hypothetical protein
VEAHAYASFGFFVTKGKRMATNFSKNCRFWYYLSQNNFHLRSLSIKQSVHVDHWHCKPIP